jgi:hypothetical protein
VTAQRQRDAAVSVAVDLVGRQIADHKCVKGSTC